MTIDHYLTTPPRHHYTEDADLKMPCMDRECRHALADHDAETGQCSHPKCITRETADDSFHEFTPPTWGEVNDMREDA